MNELICRSSEETLNQSSEIPLGSPLEEDFLWLLNAVKSLFELPPKANIYQAIAMSLKGFIGNSIIIVSLCNELKSTIRVRAAAGIGPQIDELICMLGKRLIGLSVPISIAARNGLTTEKLEKVDGGIYELATGSLPTHICNNIQGILNISKVYAMGLIWRGKLIGSVAILMRDNSEIKNVKITETFLNYAAAVVLQRQTKQLGA